MEAALIEALKSAADSPGFLSFAIVGGLVIYVLFNRRVLTLQAVSDLQVKIATLGSDERACVKRCADLERRIEALEAENLALIQGK
jgi:hypothetical protein